MSDSASPSAFIAARHAYVDVTFAHLVEEGDPSAAMLLAPKGLRIAAMKLARFDNSDSFFLEPDEYHRQNPPQNTVLLVSHEGTEGGAVVDAETAEVEDLLHAGNSVMVARLGDQMEEPQPQQPEPGLSTVKKKPTK